jgi:tellurite resistance protein
MTTIEQESILTLALMAAFADGAKHDAERAELKRVAERLPHADVQPAALYQRVLLNQVTPAQAATTLQPPELRQLAYEMAACVCDADGAQSDAEKAFLAGLRRELKLEEKATTPVESAAEALAVEPLAEGVGLTSQVLEGCARKLAQQYYAGGRKLSAIELRSTFGSLTEQARALHSRYAGDIQQKAGSVNVSQLLPLIRGQ